jgi:hypothetical protein
MTDASKPTKYTIMIGYNILHCLREAVRGKRPEKWRTNSWFLLHDNVPAHHLVLVKDSLAKNNVTTLEHPLYSPDPLQLTFTCSLEQNQH